MHIRYVVDGLSRRGHRGSFAIELEGVDSPTLDLVVPVWVPGSYHLVNYVRGFREMGARAGAGGDSLRVERVESSRWRVHTGGHPKVRVEYSVYGHEMVTEAFDLNAEHLFLNAALCLPFVDGHATEPVEVEFHLPPDWKVVTELEQIQSRPPTFRAPNYDVLVDSPIDAGHPVVLTVRPHGIPHRISLCGEGGNYEAHRLEEDLGKIADAAIRLVGDSPLQGYTFFVHLNDMPDGGLEHSTSNSAVVPRTTFEPRERYEWFLGLQSHEYFHLYNVKAIRTKAFEPFDYTRENYSGLLWWMEGTTDYFADLVLRRAGLLTPTRFLEENAKLAKRNLDAPGRNALSLEEISRIAWVDYYQQYEETPNQSSDYYTKGYLVSMCLDLEIRHRTETASSLETVFRLLWKEYGKVGRRVGEGDIQPVAERATGLGLEEFFDRYVRGTTELDIDRFARFAGLAFAGKARPPEDTSAVPGYLGVRHRDSAGFVRLSHVLLDTPAYRAGLSPGDEIVAINGSKTSAASFTKDLEAYPPGTALDLAVFRRGYLRHLSVTTGSPPPEKYQFTPVDQPTDLERKVYESWLGAAWEPAKKESAPSPPPTTRAGGMAPRSS